MDDSAGTTPDENSKAENDGSRAVETAAGGAPSESKASEAKLPVVWSPALNSGEGSADEIHAGPGDAETVSSSAETAKEDAAESPNGPATSAQMTHSLRFAMLAASLAAAAALGSFVGALSATGIVHVWPAATRNSTAAANGAAIAKAELAELSALKANIDSATRNAGGQFAKLTERLDRLERAQAEPAAKLAHLAEAIDRLEKKNVTAAAAASPETTGSITSGPSAPALETKVPENVLRDWIVQDVRGGRALVENRLGALFDVAAGSVLPGAGKVEAIKRQDNKWFVVTGHGLIYSVP
jgi:hypothetical protein